MKTITVITITFLLISNVWAKKRKASSEEIQHFVSNSLQAGIDEVTDSWYLMPKYVLVGDVSISNPILTNIMSAIVEPITDKINGGLNNEHGPNIYHLVRFTIRDQDDRCHRAQLFVQEKRIGPESNLYNYAKTHVEKHEKVILLHNEAISKLSFTNTWDGTTRYFFNRTIIDKENIVCPEKNPTVDQSSRGNSKPQNIDDDHSTNANVLSN